MVVSAIKIRRHGLALAGLLFLYNLTVGKHSLALNHCYLPIEVVIYK
jgi:hypothetical protein